MEELRERKVLGFCGKRKERVRHNFHVPVRKTKRNRVLGESEQSQGNC